MTSITPAAGGPDTAPSLTRWAWLSLAAALVTMALKGTAYLITGSVGLLSDALESTVNLTAAIVAVVALRVAAQPADAEHHFGHGKAEYFAAGVEGLMIFAAASAILVASVERIINPRPLESVGLGLAITVAAALLNGLVGLALVRVGRRHRSLTLVADGQHLLTDVWTSAGVVVGVTAVALTGWTVLDPIVALVVGVNILVVGTALLRRSVSGLMDRALPQQDHDAVIRVLESHRGDGVDFHALQTREAGQHRYVSVHVLVPGAWSVQLGHDLLERIEADLREALPGVRVHTHLEPVEDPVSWTDADHHYDALE